MRVYHDDSLVLGQKVIPEKNTATTDDKVQQTNPEGTSRYKTLIIAFTAEDFLIVNINGTGYTQILDSFVREIRSIQ